jgi:tryptophanyl-tRNA synthetase
MEKKIIYSAIQSSGTPSLGNYLGALRNWINMQNNFDCIFAVADLHSITVRQDPEEFKKNSRAMFLLLLSIGLDPDKSIIYYQSHVHEHCELTWLLSCYTQIGELNRMTQFKDKSKKYHENVNAGLYTYPVLMAADILLYDTDLVPVGIDQKQHVEIARDIANRFNSIYGESFKLPDAYINPVGAKIMDLQEPNKKMSKSNINSGVIFLFDSPEIINNKIKRAVTDSDNKIFFDESKPGVSNLLNIFSAAKNISLEETENIFKNKNYGELKNQTARAIIDLLSPIQEKYKKLSQNQNYLDKIILQGKQKASERAAKKLKEIKNKIGFIN